MNLEEIDQLVEDYLKYRNYHESFHILQKERKERNEKNSKLSLQLQQSQQLNDINERILKALEKIDTLKLLTLWDTYVTQTLDPLNSELVISARIAEFYLHLYCATYPFRDEVLKNVKSPSEAAKFAARSMTIFKHFIETRGRRLVKTPEFQQFKNFHKIAFPPTHPSFSHLFRSAWQENTKAKIVTFLSEYLQPPTPQLLIILKETEQNIHNAVISREHEIRTVFKKREQKLLDFSRSIYAISNDLLNAIDEGGSIDKEFLYNFRLKFDEFHEVLGGAGEVLNMRPKRKRRLKPHKNKTIHEPHYNDLDYTVINLELSSMVSEVEHELTNYKKPGKRLGSIDVEIAMQSSMQGSALYMALLVFMTRDIDESQSQSQPLLNPSNNNNNNSNNNSNSNNSNNSNGLEVSNGVKQTRRYAAKKYLEYDIFGLKNPVASTRLDDSNGNVNGNGDSASISPRSGYMITFLHSYAMNIDELCSHQYDPTIHHHHHQQQQQQQQATTQNSQNGNSNNSNSNNQHTNEQILENHYGELFEASSALCHSLLLTFAVMLNTISYRELSDLIPKFSLSDSMSKVYLTLCEIFLSLPKQPSIYISHKILVTLKEIIFICLISMGYDRKHKLTFIKTGCMDYLIQLLDSINKQQEKEQQQQQITDIIENTNSNVNILILLLLYSVIGSFEAFRAMLATTKSSFYCRSLLNYIVNYMINVKLNNELSEENSLILRVLLRLLYSLFNEKISKEILYNESKDQIELLKLLFQSSEFQSFTSLNSEIKLLHSNLLYHFSNASFEENNNPGENNLFLTELNEIKVLVEIPLPLDDLLYSYLLSLPEESHLKEYKVEKPKDIGMNLLINYTKSYIEEHGSLYEGTGGTD